MVARGMLGNKTKGGFYKKQKGEGGQAGNMDPRNRFARISPVAEGETTGVGYGEEYRGHVGANQDAGLG